MNQNWIFPVFRLNTICFSAIGWQKRVSGVPHFPLLSHSAKRQIPGAKTLAHVTRVSMEDHGTRARNKGILAANQRPNQQIASALCYTDRPRLFADKSTRGKKSWLRQFRSPNRAKRLNTHTTFMFSNRIFLTCKQETFSNFSFFVRQIFFLFVLPMTTAVLIS